jgi:hypothetical protein
MRKRVKCFTEYATVYWDLIRREEDTPAAWRLITKVPYQLLTWGEFTDEDKLDLLKHIKNNSYYQKWSHSGSQRIDRPQTEALRLWMGRFRTQFYKEHRHLHRRVRVPIGMIARRDKY